MKNENCDTYSQCLATIDTQRAELYTLNNTYSV